MTTKTAKKGVCGFPPSVFLRPDGEAVSNSAASGDFQGLENERLLVLSNLRKAPAKQPKRKRTKNRKYVTYSDEFTHDGVTYGINNSPSYGIYSPMLHKMIEQLNICLKKWRRVFMIRFDLHQEFHTANNAMVSRFRDNLVRRLQRAYEVSEVGYGWCREQERAKQQHYHFVMFLDGDKINHPSLVRKAICECWDKLKVGNYARCADAGYYNIHIDDSEARQEAVYRFSYLAKQRGKGYRPSQTKDYGTSRLNSPKDKLWQDQQSTHLNY